MDWFVKKRGPRGGQYETVVQGADLEEAGRNAAAWAGTGTIVLLVRADMTDEARAAVAAKLIDAVPALTEAEARALAAGS